MHKYNVWCMVQLVEGGTMHNAQCTSIMCGAWYSCTMVTQCTMHMHNVCCMVKLYDGDTLHKYNVWFLVQLVEGSTLHRTYSWGWMHSSTFLNLMMIPQSKVASCRLYTFHSNWLHQMVKVQNHFNKNKKEEKKTIKERARKEQENKKERTGKEQECNKERPRKRVRKDQEKCKKRTRK